MTLHHVATGPGRVAARVDPAGRRPAARAGRAPRPAVRCPTRRAGHGARCTRSGRRTSEAAYLAHALRAAHLLDGVPWSRMAVLMRSTTLQLPVAAAGAARGRRADRRARRRPAAAPAAGGRAAAAAAALRAGAGAARRGGGGRAAALAAGRGRPAGRAAAAAGAAGARAGRRRPAAVRASCSSTRCATRPSWPAVERRWAAPAKQVARLLAVARAAAARAGRHRRGRALGGVAGQRAGRPLVRGDRPRRPGPRRARPGRAGGPRRPTATSTRWWCSSTRRPASSTGCPARAPRSSSTTCSASSCRPTRSRRAPTGARPSGCSPRTRPRAWSGTWWRWPGVQEGVWPDLRLRGQLLGSERLVDVLAGRAEGAGLAASLVGQTSALLDEERRLFYVAATRARRRLLVTAVDVGGGGRRRPRGAAQPVPARAARPARTRARPRTRRGGPGAAGRPRSGRRPGRSGCRWPDVAVAGWRPPAMRSRRPAATAPRAGVQSRRRRADVAVGCAPMRAGAARCRLASGDTGAGRWPPTWSGPVRSRRRR